MVPHSSTFLRTDRYVPHLAMLPKDLMEARVPLRTSSWSPWKLRSRSTAADMLTDGSAAVLFAEPYPATRLTLDKYAAWFPAPAGSCSCGSSCQSRAAT